jgi:uncharacterized protein YjbI with pentapeptide repeats
MMMASEESQIVKLKGICLLGTNLSRLEFKTAHFDLSDLRSCKLEMTEFYNSSFRKVKIKKLKLVHVGLL